MNTEKKQDSAVSRSGTDKIRLFTGISLSESLLKQSQEFKNYYGHPNELNWTPLENLHITLFFIGSTTIEKLPEIINLLDSISKNHNKFKIFFDKLIIKKRNGNASMVWAQYLKNDQFQKILQDISQSINQIITIKSDYKDPIPHITLARVKSNMKINLPSIKFEKKFDDIVVDNFILWQSKLKPTGAEYSPLKTYNLI